jgi:hypothetical protein
LAAVQWSLIPHVETAALLNYRCDKGEDLKKEVGKNTLVGLMTLDHLADRG